MQRGSAKKPPLDWDDVRCFLALVRAGSLVGGARALGIDKSTLSRRIKGLERAVGAQLFLRTVEGLRPSAAATAIFARAESAELELRALRSDAAIGGGEVGGLVRLATTEGLAVRLVALGLLDLCERHPSIELEVLGGNTPLDLAKDEADLALRVTPITGPDLKVRVVARLGFALFASSTYLARRGRPRTVAQLRGHDVILPSGDLARLPEGRWLAARPGVRVTFRSSSLPALAEAAARGHGLCALVDAWGAGVPGLEVVLPLPQIPDRAIWLASHPLVADRPAVRVVADHIVDLLRR